MKRIRVILLVLLALTNHLQGAKTSSENENFAINKERLHFINKSPIKSFQTRYGDVLDCVEINKQYAFDHPLLKNHSIQMKPSFKVSKQTSTPRSSVVLKPSQFLPKNVRCPRGTVPIRRIKEEDLAMEKFSSLIGTKFSTTATSYKSINDLNPGQFASLVSSAEAFGATGVINVWNPEVLADQLSDASIYVASDDASLSNGITAGWMVNPNVFQNSSSTRFYAYWTKDSGQSTGCFNTLCPGFVQVSQKVSLGLNVEPVSTYDGTQYFFKVTIQQDDQTKDWWIFYGDEAVGYYPKELFTTLTNGATKAGWGGEISSPATEPSPAMGSGHFPEEGSSKASLIYGLGVIRPKSAPKPSDLKLEMSKPDCYKAIYPSDASETLGHYMFFGGPSNCKR